MKKEYTRLPTTVIKQRPNLGMILERGDIGIVGDLLSHKTYQVKLSPKETLLAQILLLNFGVTVTYNDMLDWLYVAHDNLEPETNTSHALMMSLYGLRDKVESVGLMMLNWHSVGFRMVSK